MNDYVKNILENLSAVIGHPNRLKATIGAKHFVYDHDKETNNVSFAFKHMKGKHGENYCKITYVAATDLYAMEFGKIKSLDYTVIAKLGDEGYGVFFDQLKELFEEQTGLYLTL